MTWQPIVHLAKARLAQLLVVAMVANISSLLLWLKTIVSQSVHSDVLPVYAHMCRSPGGDLGAKRKKKKQKRKKEKPSSGGAKSDSASDSQEFKVR